MIREAVGKRVVEQGPHVARPIAGKHWVCGFERAFGFPPAVSGDGDPFVLRDNMAHTLRSADRLFREARELAAWRRHSYRREKHSRKAHVAGKAQAAVGLRRP